MNLNFKKLINSLKNNWTNLDSFMNQKSKDLNSDSKMRKNVIQDVLMIWLKSMKWS